MKPSVLPPENRVLRPRTKLGSKLFANENLDLLARVLDEWFRIPGTSIRFGLDGIIGLVPWAGDVLAGLASYVIIIAAWFRGVPYITLTRMVVNLGIDVIIGSIPLLGDAFDIAWKANRRNYALVSRHLEQPHRHTWKDWVFLLLIAIAVAAIFVVPLLLLILAMEWLAHHTALAGYP
jgi:hypothetical protein